MEKIKLLLVVTEFWQAGCQRYNYELDSNIDKSKFNNEILSFRDLSTNPDWPDYYYKHHKKLGTQIRFLSEFYEEKRRIVKSSNVLNVRGLNDYFDSFDIVLFQGEYCWNRFMNYMKFDTERFFISLHNSRLQNADNYIFYDKSIKYNFVSSFTSDQIDFELAEFDDYNYFYFPFSISADWKNQWLETSKNQSRIAIFTRLTSGKPIEPFLYSFQNILKSNPSVELWIYGNGDSNEVGLDRHIEILNLGDKVKFKGHSEDIVKSAINDGINLVLMHSYHKIPGGFASFQLSSAGIPQVFFEMIPQDFFTDNEAFFCTNEINALSEKVNHFLKDDLSLIDCSKEQFDHSFKERNIESNIKKLEDYFISKAGK
ncbi:MAG: hypothetical protein CMP61_09445 [Flavobacteriales bacterium]|nr:hypothetical protein [Flavobacteriales bacterium]|tara:strand:+ start:16424 stop:17536 length:1113 start_codon:yes stop_codon:yes gene_type:complete